ncbi:MAG: 4'-phosphopantetheinyl transferase superfamily protein [Chitinophagaceae bacterium]|nr:MAG: 4'-phosphopantetheinyl transferase superfamily protein [Chitinophagaceae bacterium]
MSLIKLLETTGETKIGVWKMEEEDAFFSEKLILNAYDTEVLNKRSHPIKKKEWLASRFLLKSLLNYKKQLILKANGNGRPFLENHKAEVSLSHSHEMVAAICSYVYKVSIDIEKIQPKILNITKKFCSDDEKEMVKNMDEVLFYTIIWSVKETAFKLYDDYHLAFKENIQITALIFKGDKGHCIVEINKSGFYKKLKVPVYLIRENYILSYSTL